MEVASKKNKVAAEPVSTVTLNNITFNLGDSVRVQAGIEVTESGANIAGYQGRILSLDHNRIRIEWDSITLQQISDEELCYCETHDLEYNTYSFPFDAAFVIEKTSPRDTKTDVALMCAATLIRIAKLGFKVSNPREKIEIS